MRSTSGFLIPHVGSYVEVRSTSGYIRDVYRKDDASVVSSLQPPQRPRTVRINQEDDDSIWYLGKKSKTPEAPKDPLALTAAQTAAMEFTRHANRRLPPEQKDITRHTLPTKYTWDGSMDSFPVFQAQVEGFYSQIGAGYLFLEDFQSRYLMNGTQCWIYFQDNVHSQSQTKKDIEALYGALKTACQSGVGKSAILSHKKTQDGVRAWMEMVSKYENGGDRETRINTLEAVIDTPFHGRYKGGLLQWITDYENAFAELAELGCANWNDEARKRRILKNVSEENGLDKFVFKELTKDMDYEGFWVN